MPDLSRADTGAWLWQHLRDAFPQAIAVVRMPDHPHVLLATAEPDEARKRLARLLGSAERLAAAMQCSPRDFAARHHAYVSGDPDAHVVGTPMPTAVPTSKVPNVPLHAIAEAAAAAMHRPLDAIRTRAPTRALCVALAVDQGWTLPQRLADLCACSTRTIANLAHDVDPAALSAARLCLGDTRFTRPERRESSNAA